MTAVTLSGWERAMACEPPSISLMVAPMRWAAARSESGLIARSAVATMNQLGVFFHPGVTASGSPKPIPDAGRWL
jgi:hypothetical protein